MRLGCSSDHVVRQALFVEAIVDPVSMRARNHVRRSASENDGLSVLKVGLIEVEIDGATVRVGRGAEAKDDRGRPARAEEDIVIGPSGTVRVMVATKPVDFRKGADGLAAIVREAMRDDPFSGAVYVFRSKRADRVKLIFWDGTGVCLFAKRLEDGKFQWPTIGDGVLRLSAAQLAALLEGLDWRRVYTATNGSYSNRNFVAHR